jgi:hypothetical protein
MRSWSISFARLDGVVGASVGRRYRKAKPSFMSYGIEFSQESEIKLNSIAATLAG